MHLLPVVRAMGIILKLGDPPKYRQWRLVWIRNIELAKQHDVDHYIRLPGFPSDLPDLSVLNSISTTCSPTVSRKLITRFESVDNCQNMTSNKGKNLSLRLLPACFMAGGKTMSLNSFSFLNVTELSRIHDAT